MESGFAEVEDLQHANPTANIKLFGKYHHTSTNVTLSSPRNLCDGKTRGLGTSFRFLLRAILLPATKMSCLPFEPFWHLHLQNDCGLEAKTAEYYWSFLSIRRLLFSENGKCMYVCTSFYLLNSVSNSSLHLDSEVECNQVGLHLLSTVNLRYLSFTWVFSVHATLYYT